MEHDLDVYFRLYHSYFTVPETTAWEIARMAIERDKALRQRRKELNDSAVREISQTEQDRIRRWKSLAAASMKQLEKSHNQRIYAAIREAHYGKPKDAMVG